MYNYNKNGPIRQGDLFYHIPYLSFDLLVRSTENNKSIYDQSDEIINEIIETGNDILIETILASTVCILASQDCDIKHSKDLIFFQLSEYNVSEKKIKAFIKADISGSTQFCYFPKLKLPNSKIIGPFRINFTDPIKIPSKLIKNKLRDLRIARIIDSARKFFIGKLTNFFSRMPIDEILFLENKEIQNLITEEWKECEFDKNKMQQRIKEIKYTLTKANRSDDIQKIYFDNPINTEKIERIKQKLLELDLENETEPIIKICDEILNSESELEMSKKNKQLINKLYVEDNCLIIRLNSTEIKKELDEKMTQFAGDKIKIIQIKKAIEYFEKDKNRFQE